MEARLLPRPVACNARRRGGGGGGSGGCGGGSAPQPTSRDETLFGWGGGPMWTRSGQLRGGAAYREG